MSIDVERLINMVRARPPLWDQKHKHYHNRNVVDRLWYETATALNHKTIVIKKKWKSLRDQFRTELKKVPAAHYNNLGPDSCFENMPVWPHFKPLLFIKEHMKTRRPLDKQQQQEEQTSLDDYSYIENDDNNSNENNEKYCIQSGQDLFEVETLNTAQETREKTNHHEDSYSEQVGLKKRKRDQISRNVQLRGDDDEDIAFFTSLLPHVRKMDPARKLLCRMEIQNSIYNHAYRNGRPGHHETILRDESSQFSESILSTHDQLHYDSKDHIFFQRQSNNN